MGKTLELGVGVLLVALLTATLFGGLVPEYRAAVGDELGERTLVAGAERIEAAVPPGDVVAVDRTVTVRLPPTIRGDRYRIVVDDEGDATALRLVHPDRSIRGRVRPAIPGAASLSGSWTSSSPSRIRVSVDGGAGSDRPGRTLSVRLVDGETAAPAGTEGAASA